MTLADNNGRPWAKLSELKADDAIELDEGFTCRSTRFATVFKDEDGDLYFRCSHGKHFLSGQAADGKHCVGIYKAK